MTAAPLGAGRRARAIADLDAARARTSTWAYDADESPGLYGTSARTAGSRAVQYCPSASTATVRARSSSGWIEVLGELCGELRRRGDGATGIHL